MLNFRRQLIAAIIAKGIVNFVVTLEFLHGRSDLFVQLPEQLFRLFSGDRLKTVGVAHHPRTVDADLGQLGDPQLQRLLA